MHWFFKTGLLSIVLFVIFTGSSAVNAQDQNDIVVIVNKTSNINSVSINDVKRVFLKEQSVLSGKKVLPINAKQSSALRNNFRVKVLKMSSFQEAGYWETQKIKAGIRPPAELSNTVKAVFSIKNGISYCYRKDFNPAVSKIVLTL